MIKNLITILLGATLLAGCSQRENAKSAIIADQAAVAIVKILESRAATAALDTELDKCLSLAYTAHMNIAPVIKELSGQERLEVPTTVELAVTNTPTFQQEAAKQAGRAEGETASNAQMRQLGAAGVGGLGGLLNLVAGGTAVGGLLLALLKSRALTKVKDTLETVTAFSQDALVTDPKDAKAIEALKAKHPKAVEHIDI